MSSVSIWLFLSLQLRFLRWYLINFSISNKRKCSSVHVMLSRHSINMYWFIKLHLYPNSPLITLNFWWITFSPKGSNLKAPSTFPLLTHLVPALIHACLHRTCWKHPKQPAYMQTHSLSINDPSPPSQSSLHLSASEPLHFLYVPWAFLVQTIRQEKCLEQTFEHAHSPTQRKTHHLL